MMPRKSSWALGWTVKIGVSTDMMATAAQQWGGGPHCEEGKWGKQTDVQLPSRVFYRDATIEISTKA